MDERGLGDQFLCGYLDRKVCSRFRKHHVGLLVVGLAIERDDVVEEKPKICEEPLLLLLALRFLLVVQLLHQLLVLNKSEICKIMFIDKYLITLCLFTFNRNVLDFFSSWFFCRDWSCLSWLFWSWSGFFWFYKF